jgi:hypothetical protein
MPSTTIFGYATFVTASNMDKAKLYTASCAATPPSISRHRVFDSPSTASHLRPLFSHDGSEQVADAKISADLEVNPLNGVQSRTSTSE